MKRILTLGILVTINAFSIERKELLSLIEDASVKRESAYVEVRNKIVGYDTNALPLLVEFAMDEFLPWQQQLVARICYERILRKEEIEKVIATNWYAHPKFNPEWNEYRSGPERNMKDMVVGELKAVGLWYYYLELEWKMTGEKAETRGNNTDRWISWCTLAVKDNPEERIWFLRVCADLMETTPSHPRSSLLYSYLLDAKNPDAVPLLLQHFDMYMKSKPVEFDPDTWPLEVEKYADARSADLFDAFLQTHSNKFKLTAAKIRARPAPTPTPEPSFRLGTNIIKRAKQP